MQTFAALQALAELALPRSCAGCGERSCAVCPRCAGAVTLARAIEATATWPSPTPPGFPRTWSQVPYDGPVAAMLRAFKDAGRCDLGDRLGLLLRGAIAAALGSDEPLRDALASGRPVLVVPVPTRAGSLRSRGRDPLAELTRHALAGTAPALRQVAALRAGRAGQDQAGLGADARSRNVSGSMVAARGSRLAGATVLVVDDIVTTGSTLAEAARSLHAAGAGAVSAATVAATQRHTAPL
ncbi:ComF family protein [Flexivirga meconopsidis]|uniref:ComF family protein n=1 Tax=Flexivirga meconopsidis TaxID=2977121 RepID=UPI00223FAC49|nr:phosphoribosyltransferase family protein [Flexivirga meconopsidis]